MSGSRSPAARVDVDHQAPLVVSSEAEITAPPEALWDVIADLESWPEWSPHVRSLEVEGPVRPGTQFRWKAGPTITSTLREVERPGRIAWVGKTFGVTAVHVWSFERRGGGTLARTSESWDGLLPRVLRGPLRRSLQKTLDESLSLLATEAERRGAAPGSP
jgi:uncharacterized protein YndB with AHSA1/START domain